MWHYIFHPIVWKHLIFEISYYETVSHFLIVHDSMLLKARNHEVITGIFQCIVSLKIKFGSNTNLFTCGQEQDSNCMEWFKKSHLIWNIHNEIFQFKYVYCYIEFYWTHLYNEKISTQVVSIENYTSWC